MATWTDSAGRLWAFHEGAAEWMAVHVIRSGDTLWNLAGRYFGTSTLTGVHAIHEVPENYAIQGSNANAGLIAGDRILIPGLPQPAVPRDPPDDPPADDEAPDDNALSDETTGDDTNGATNGDPVNGNGEVCPAGAELLNVGTDGAPVCVKPGAKPKAEASSAAKIGLVVVGLVAVGTTVWLLFRKPKRGARRRAA
jgi:hypothetical protein